MRLIIKSNSFLEACALEVHGGGISYRRTAFMGGWEHFGFREIDCILLSPENVLSIQVGRKVLSLRVNPSKEKHKRVVEALLAAIRQSV